MFHRGRRFGFEFRYTGAPGTTRSMRIAREDLRLERLFVVYPGTGGSYPLSDWVEVVALGDLERKLSGLSARPDFKGRP